MDSLSLVHTEVLLQSQRRLIRCLRIRFHAQSWHLSEEGPNRVGGIFRSLSSAVTYARNELRGVPGGRVVIERGGAVFDA
jgi:hypothetical protein